MSEARENRAGNLSGDFRFDGRPDGLYFPVDFPACIWYAVKGEQMPCAAFCFRIIKKMEDVYVKHCERRGNGKRCLPGKLNICRAGCIPSGSLPVCR